MAARCPQCSEDLEAGAKFCPRCGAPNPSAPAPAPAAETDLGKLPTPIPRAGIAFLVALVVAPAAVVAGLAIGSNLLLGAGIVMVVGLIALLVLGSFL